MMENQSNFFSCGEHFLSFPLAGLIPKTLFLSLFWHRLGLQIQAEKKNPKWDHRKIVKGEKAAALEWGQPRGLKSSRFSSQTSSLERGACRTALEERKTSQKTPRLAHGWLVVGARGMAGASLTNPVMSGGIIYADLDIKAGKRREQRLLPQPGASGCPQWHRPALWAGWTGNLLLGAAVVAVGCLALHQQPENSGSRKNESGNVGDGSTPERILRELRNSLCLPEPREVGGCRLCPPHWTLHGTKCFWVGDEQKAWSQSREDCETRGAELLVPGGHEELDFLNQTLRKPSTYFWIGLSVPPTGQGWTWLNGSRLAPGWLQPTLKAEFGKCGALRGGRIVPENCSSVSKWICQKPAPQL